MATFFEKYTFSELTLKEIEIASNSAAAKKLSFSLRKKNLPPKETSSLIMPLLLSLQKNSILANFMSIWHKLKFFRIRGSIEKIYSTDPPVGSLWFLIED